MTQSPQPSFSPSSSIRSLLIGIWRHLSRRRRLQLGLALLLMVSSGMAEVGSLAAVVPFLAVLSDPQRLWQIPLVQSLAVDLGITAANELLLPVTLLFGFSAVLAAAVRLLNLWVNSRLVAAVGSDLSCEAYRRTLYQPYSVHVQRNSSGVISGITSQVGSTVVALNAILQLLTAAVVVVGILGALLAIEWSVACTAIAVFGLAYGVLLVTTRRRLTANSHLVTAASKQQMKALQEGLGAIRDVLLDGCQQTYMDIYQRTDRPMRVRQAQNTFLAAFPRFGLEALGLVLIALLAFLLSTQGSGSIGIIPILGTLALGSQRLLPSLQQIYANWTLLLSVSSQVKLTLEMLNQPLQQKLHSDQQLPLRQSICMENITFGYSQNQPNVLHSLNLKILRGERIGLIGCTGSGKSTTVDILMGLLKPTSGKLLVDGLDIHDPLNPERLLAWRASIAHVPQAVYLTDNSIAENIAFGVPLQNIDFDLVKQAAAQAQIASFIESNPDGYYSTVGERGIRLSGGQRQRLGLARALYKKSQVLVLDEATSALDTRTENSVMEAIDSLSESLTVIMIAHRLSTVENCDRLILLEQGSVTADGPPQLVLPSQV